MNEKSKLIEEARRAIIVADKLKERSDIARIRSYCEAISKLLLSEVS